MLRWFQHIMFLLQIQKSNTYIINYYWNKIKIISLHLKIQG